VRLILIGLLLAPTVALADEPPILSLEMRLSGGLTLAEGSNATMKPAPVGVGVGAESAVLAQPWTSIYYGAYLDTLAAIDMGVSAGLRFRPQTGRLRFGVGGTAVVLPAMKAGIQAAFGACIQSSSLHYCLDIEGTTYLAGDNMPSGTIDARLGVALEVGLDVL
jgi:hypothetical protein